MAFMQKQRGWGVEEESVGLEGRQRRRKTANAVDLAPTGAPLEEDDAEAEQSSVCFGADGGMKPKKDDQIAALQEELAKERLYFKCEIINGQKGIPTEGANHVLKNEMERGSNSLCYTETHGAEIVENEDEMAVHEQITVTKRSKLEAVEIDLENILEEQDTHDLYCPNCKSCITKRVILRRKRETPPEPDVFRCLSCFSFFIPTDVGGSICRLFEKATKETTDVRGSEEVPEKTFTWISYIFNWAISREKPSEPAIITQVLAPEHVPVDVEDQTPRDPEIIINNDWDVLKSIVYGGLTESITSLGVVSSAAGTGASTWNIIALGLANLIGGFFLITHDLFELRTAQGRYQEVLGRRSNFRLHFVIAVISYIVFGLVPPLVYGFSFRESDNTEYNIIAVAAASLLCTSLLAIGKAHCNPLNKPYAKTLFYYLSLAVPASGVSYAAGLMVDRVLEQLGWFAHSAAPPSPPTALMRQGLSSSLRAPAWASY